MNFYVVGYLPRESDPTLPDFRTGKLVSGHTERAVAERMAAGMGWQPRFGTIFAVCAPGELRGPLRRAGGQCLATTSAAGAD